MAAFGIRFLLCNLFLCFITGVFLLVKRLLRNQLTPRMQFALWFPFLGLLAVPFLSVRPAGFSLLSFLPDRWRDAASFGIKSAGGTPFTGNIPAAAAQIDDFALSVSSRIPSLFWLALTVVWLLGTLVMLFFLMRSKSRLHALKKSALPLQNTEIRRLYDSCLRELHIKRDIPVYSTAYLGSPVIAGLLNPCIYLPLHLISDFHAGGGRQCDPSRQHSDFRGQDDIPGGQFDARDIRCMLLHELQHYRRRDALTGCLINLFGALYWCNPLVWRALREMRDDREIACDASVLELLDESECVAYGSTLINFAEKISSTPFPFAAGISGNMRQMRKRILRIASYRQPSARQKIKSGILFAAAAVMLFLSAPMLSTPAADLPRYNWNVSPEKVSVTDLSACFDGFEGSFVLYDLKADTWIVHDMDRAVSRVSPNSTYKIYDALFALEEGIITPEDSFMAWDGTTYPFEEWNTGQDLHSAMRSSVNWYFQNNDGQLGASAVKDYVRKIGYGNENTNADLSSYWMQSTLKISPVEQVTLLTALYHNSFAFARKNVDAVMDAICLSSSENGSFYGKTGTGRVDGRDVNGWFVGFAETGDNAYFFSVNIQGDADASGSRAAEIAGAVLADLSIPGKDFHCHSPMRY